MTHYTTTRPSPKNTTDEDITISLRRREASNPPTGLLYGKRVYDRLGALPPPPPQPHFTSTFTPTSAAAHPITPSPEKTQRLNPPTIEPTPTPTGAPATGSDAAPIRKGNMDRDHSHMGRTDAAHKLEDYFRHHHTTARQRSPSRWLSEGLGNKIPTDSKTQNRMNFEDQSTAAGGSNWGDESERFPHTRPTTGTRPTSADNEIHPHCDNDANEDPPAPRIRLTPRPEPIRTPSRSTNDQRLDEDTRKGSTYVPPAQYNHTDRLTCTNITYHTDRLLENVVEPVPQGLGKCH